MGDYGNIVPPHLNAEVYRSDTTGNSNVSFLDYIRIHKDGSVLVGNSELTGRYWDGGATVFKDIITGKDAKSFEKRSISLLSGTPDGCFVGTSNKILLCEDRGAVSIWSSDDEQAWPMWRLEKAVVEHDAATLAVDCLTEGGEYVTAGADGNAKVWDVNELICVRHYEAHTSSIFGVAVQPESTSNFATCSYDDHITLWNVNFDKPAQELFKNDCGIRCVKWLDENMLLFGDEAGMLRMLDTRNKSVFQLTEFPAAIHKLAVDEQNQRVAVCCDNTIVTVCEITPDSQCKTVYQDRNTHSNFVRGIHWDQNDSNVLHTVGWDSVIKSHSIV